MNRIEKQVLVLREQANQILHQEIEQEMWKVMLKQPSLTCALKCMGQVVLYNKNGPLDDIGEYAKPWPRSANRLRRLSEMDNEYYSLTGHPLKLYRGANGQILNARDW